MFYKTPKYFFDQEYNNPYQFHYEDGKILTNPSLKGKYAITSEYRIRSSRSTIDMKIFEDLFEINNHELFLRMDEISVIKTLTFINKNNTENSLFCLTTIPTATDRYYLKGLKRRLLTDNDQSQVENGHLVLFIVENVPKKSYKKDKNNLKLLIKGRSPIEFLRKNASLMINFNQIASMNADEVGSYLSNLKNSKEIQPIPLYVTFNHENYIAFESNHFEVNGNTVTKLYFLIILLLKNYNKAKFYPTDENQESIIDLLNQVCSKTQQYFTQGPFHKWKCNIRDYMTDLAQLKYKLKQLFGANNDFNQYIAILNQCQNLLQRLINENFLPAQNDWTEIGYMILLKKREEKNWDNQIIITSKKWILPFKTFYDDDGHVAGNGKEKSLENFVWLFDEQNEADEPYLIIQKQQFCIAIVKETLVSNLVCEHLTSSRKIKYICVKCKEMADQHHNCSCGTINYLTAQCLQCWNKQFNIGINTNTSAELTESINEVIPSSNTDLIVYQKDTNVQKESNSEPNPKVDQCDFEKVIQTCSETLMERKQQKEELLENENIKENNFLVEKYKALKGENSNHTNQYGKLKQKLNTNQLQSQKIKKRWQNAKDKVISLRIRQENLKPIIEQVTKQQKELGESECKYNMDLFNLKTENQNLKENYEQQKQELKEANEKIARLAKEIKKLTATVPITGFCNIALDGSTEKTKDNDCKEEQNLKNSVKIIDEGKTYTVVFFGDNGVRKSILVNGLKNYLKWPKFEEAVKNKKNLEICMPVQFTVSENADSELSLSVGMKNVNEDKHSKTQNSNVYTFNINNDIIRVIDIPDLKSTQDSNYSKLAFKTINDQEQIHGICIVIEMSEVKSTLDYEKEILQNLAPFPKSALNNVFLFFTFNSLRIIGDIMSLRENMDKSDEIFSLLKENFHYVDSDSLKFLLCKKQGIGYGSNLETDYTDSWEITARNVFKFFEKLKMAKPIPKNKILACDKLIKWTNAVIQKKDLVKSNQKTVYDHIVESIKFMARKHTFMKFTTNLENLTAEDFYRSIDDFVKVAGNGGCFLDGCNKIIRILEED